VSRSGLVPLVPSQDSPGPIARSVADAVIVLSAIAGADMRDTASLAVPRLPRDSHPRREIAGLRIGVPRRAMADRQEFAKLMPSFNRVLFELSRAGAAVIDPCDLPSAEQLQDVRSCVFRTEFKASLDTFLEEAGGPCGISSLATLIRWNEEHPEAIPYGQSLLLAANETKGLDDLSYRSDRARDIALSRKAGIDAAFLMSDLDVLITPMGAAAKCTGKAGAPVVAIPCGLDAEGAPFGVTLFAPWGSDWRLIAASRAIESIVGERCIP
jgi:amidase